jgi:hypothetical protein
MSKSFDEICNSVLGEDINVALWENVPANVQQVVQQLFKDHGSNPELIKNLEIELNKAKSAPKPATTPANQTAQQTTPQQSGQNTANKATTPTQPNQPQQGTQPTK